MTNPNDAVGTNAAYGGRTSANAFNDGLALFSSGILSGWACAPDSGLTVSLGGDGNTRDAAVAQDSAGNNITINNISGSPINVTLSAAPGANSRIDAIVAYVDNPPQGVSTVADNPSACGIIAVDGVAAASPVAPSDNAIRSAITADGASGTTAYYVVLATVTVANGTTDITSDDIQQGDVASVHGNNSSVDTITGYASVGSTSTQLSGTYTAPTSGLYFVSASVLGGSSGSTKFNTNTSIYCGTQIIANAGRSSTENYVGNNFTQIAYSGIGWCNAGDTIYITAQNSNWSGRVEHSTRIKKIF